MTMKPQPCGMSLAKTWIIYLVAGWATQCSGQKSVIIVDCGSSGSRLHVFDMSHEGVKALGLFKTEPGISSYADKPGQAGESLRVLLDSAKELIPAEQQSETKLYVKATAGLRLLSVKATKDIMRAVGVYLANPANCPFKFITQEMISGEEEAVFQYIALNHLLAKPVDSHSDSGILSVGGASLQVLFRPDGDVRDSEFEVYMGGHRTSLYAKSFMRFGQNQARLRAQELLAKVSPVSTDIDFACGNPGDQEEVELNGRKVTFHGTGDSPGCSKLTASLLHEDYECLMEPCGIMGVYMPPIRGNFVATDCFFYTVNGIGLVERDESKVVTPASIGEAAEAFCGKSLDGLHDETDIPVKFLRQNCFMAHFIRNILRAFGFPDDDKSVTYARKVAGHQVEYAVGAALYETRYMPLTLPSRSRPCPGVEDLFEVGTDVPPRTFNYVGTGLLGLTCVGAAVVGIRRFWSSRRQRWSFLDSDDAIE
mmetsp:Transcript_43109/g.93904  ORF Transcript_43109/g.93904 Transcript_43109/m.93904 type:complete len:481 (-) Transcript_43109:131-1573(-)